MQQANLLIEIGTEELPPKALNTLSHALADEFVRQLDDAALSHGHVSVFASPRRLAFLVETLQTRQHDREIERRGPAVQAAFDEHGQPTKAAEGFAMSCGLSVDQLDRLETDKGSWLMARITEAGQPVTALIPDFLAQAVHKLPIPKRMRWGARKVQFVRPVHWLVAMLDDQVVPFNLLDQQAGNVTYGHRFHAPDAIVLEKADDYEQQLEQHGYVIARFDRRKTLVHEKAVAAGKQAGGIAEIDEALLEEVTALVEWPVALTGKFDERFLRVPQEALITAMQDHQKYFPVLNDQGKLIPYFITMSNIDSRDTQRVIAGNEKVIRPRLADAAFFYDNDCKKSLADHAEPLKQVVFQQQLGSVAEKCGRIAALAAAIAGDIGADTTLARQAGLLSKADLNSEMVYEFDTMQGVMGYYLAHHEGLPEEVAQALLEHYMPRFSGDQLPSSGIAQSVAIADKLDTLVGIFGIGQKPSGDKDPFALRRATLGIVRIIIEKQLNLDLSVLIDEAVNLYDDKLSNADTKSDVLAFIASRYRAIYQDQGIDTATILSVLNLGITRPLDFDRRVRAVHSFAALPEAQALAAANKRVSNILSKQADAAGKVNPDQLIEPAEHALADAIIQAEENVQPLADQGDYQHILNTLAALREPVDNFFDQVMVMAEDSALRNNRLALLNQLRNLFLQVADISELG